MFLVIPYNPATKADYSDLAKTIRKLGTNLNHTLAVASFREHDEEAFLFASSLSDYFGRQARIPVGEMDEGPSIPANRFFVSAVRAFGRYKPAAGEVVEAPLLYFDPRYRPNSPRWLDDLQTDYFRVGAPAVQGKFKEATIPSVLGPVIIGRQFLKVSTLFNFLPPRETWRDYLAWEMLKNSVNAEGIGPHESAVLSPAFEA